MSFSYLFDPNKQFQNRNGVNNVGGFIRVYIDGTDDRATTYKDFNGTLNEADIMLDTDGRAVVIVDDSFTFRIEVYERDGALQWTVTKFTARGEGGGGGSSTPVVVDGTANEIDVTERMTAGVKYYTIGLATVVKNTLLGLLASFSNLVGILNSKADKVQVATAGNFAALDASGNLTDSGSKVADFKTKQTPVTDPIASGAGLEFIDSISQNANGEITPHKKSVQDGTTAQKGVVKLSNAIDSTSVTEAATPKALKDAYDELNNKIVARATFLSQAEWAVQSQLPGDPAKVYYVENGTGEDAYTVYVWKESTSEYVEVDESSIDLDGYWHDAPTTTGSGNVVTNITLGNDGVPQVEKGMSAEPAFSVLPISKGGTGKTTGKAATNNLFSDINSVNTDPDDTARIVFKYGSPSDSNGIFFARAITNLWNYIKGKISSVLGLSENGYTGNAATASAAASGSALETALAGKLGTSGNGSNLSVTPDGTSTGYDLGSSTTLKAFAQKFKNLVSALKALAFKDKASYNDLSSGVQSSLDKADSALQSHQSVTDNNPTLAWGTTSKVGKVGSTDLRVTMPANPAQNLPASVITSGTFGTDRIADDAITAAKVKDNETLPVNISGSAYAVTAVSAAGNAARHVWFSDSNNETKRVYNDNFKYNPDGNIISANISGTALFSDTIYEDSSAGGRYRLHIFGTPNTNNSMAGWRTIATVTKVSSSFSSARICGKIFTSGGNWGESPNYEIDFQVIVDFTGQSYHVYHKPSSIIGSILRLIEVTQDTTYEIQVNPQGTSTYSNFWVYAWADHISNAWTIDWKQNLSDLGSNGTDKSNYTTDSRKFRLANGQVGSPATPVYVDSNGQVKECSQGATLKTNTATLYIAGYTDNNIPIYNVKDIKNGCVNHVDFSNIASANCNITFEAPTLAAGEEYDYVISLEGYTNNTGVSTGSYVENCKQVLRYDYNSNLWVGEGLFLQATDWRQICIVRGNTCEWKRVTLS